MLSRPTVGRLMPNRMRAVAAPMTARSTRCSASAPIEAPRSSTIDSPRSVGQSAAIAGRSIPRQHFELEFRHRHERAGIAARNSDVGVALFHRLDREPHRGFPAAIAQRLARFGVHAYRDLGVNDPRSRFERRLRVDKRRDLRRVAEEEKFAFGMALQRQFRTGNDHGGAVVSPHRIERNADLVWHRMIDLAVLGPGEGVPEANATIAVRRPDTTAISGHSGSLSSRRGPQTGRRPA